VVMLYQGQAIGYGYIRNADSVTQFTPFSIPIHYDSTTLVPDSATINLVACAMGGLGPSRLVVDKLSFDGFTGIEDKSAERPDVVVSLFPNPTNNLVNVIVSSEGSGSVSYRVFDLNGQQLLGAEEKPQGQTAVKVLDVSALPSGLYLLNVNAQGFSKTLR